MTVWIARPKGNGRRLVGEKVVAGPGGDPDPGEVFLAKTAPGGTFPQESFSLRRTECPDIVRK